MTHDSRKPGPKPTRRAVIGQIAAALACPGVLHAAPMERIGGRAFGTGWSVAGEGLGRASALGERIAALFARVDRQFSPWRTDSVLSRFNTASGGWVAAGPEVIAVVRAAQALHETSGGAFDPTVGPLVAQWGFGPISGGAGDPQDVRPGPRDIRLDGDALGKVRPGVTLDLCGIAKGRALDIACQVLRDQGVGAALFDLGGELLAIGRHPSGRDWQVAVEAEAGTGRGTGTAPAAILRLAPGRAVATSGIGAQSYRLAGRTYGHIVDPARARPAGEGLFSVTVLAGDAMTADGWATALFAAGPTRGVDIAAANGIDALFLPRRSAAAPVLTGRMAEAVVPGTVLGSMGEDLP